MDIKFPFKGFYVSCSELWKAAIKFGHELERDMLNRFNESFRGKELKKTYSDLEKEAWKELKKYIASILKEDLIDKTFKQEESKMAYLTAKECLKLNGKKVTCVLDGKEIKDAEIVVYKDGVSIAQDFKDGTGVKVKGYDYSWEWDGRTEKVQLAASYTYLERKKPLPSWWDGRRIYGGYSDCSEESCLEDDDRAYCVGILPNGQFLIVNDDDDDDDPTPYKYFVPEENREKKCTLTIEENGNKREVTLTKEQMESLGLL